MSRAKLAAWIFGTVFSLLVFLTAFIWFSATPDPELEFECSRHGEPCESH